MAATRTKQKASKGTVRIKTSNDRLQLVFSHGGKRHYLSLGLPDTKLNRRAAEAKAKLIEADIAFEKFDPTLAKYRSESEVEEVPEEAGVGLLTLWTQFVEFKRPQCSPNTMRQTYGPYTNHVKRFPTHELVRANEIRDYILLNLPLDAGKRLITRLAACCEWAVDSKQIDDNPFQGMASKIKMPKATAKKGLNDINPFSLSERDAIIIDTNNFRNRVWKRVLDGLGIEYRKLYQTRHTFITHALEAGMDAKDVARLVGNSPEIIYRHYAGKKRRLEVPEF